MPKTRPPYDPEFRQRILELLRSGRTLKSLAEEFGCTEQSIRNWQRQGGRAAPERKEALSSEEKEELARLRREVRVLREERDILKKAAIFLHLHGLPPEGAGGLTRFWSPSRRGTAMSYKAHRHLRGRYVFCQEDGQPLTAGKMVQPLRRALKRAGISREEGRIGWHDLRHTYASHLAMRGVPLKVIQELMGHVTIEMTERYAHLSPDTRREAVGVLDRPLPLAAACDIRATRMEEAANHP
jgi:transposase-like protein